MPCPVCHTRLFPVGSFQPQYLPIPVRRPVTAATNSKILSVSQVARLRKVRTAITEGNNPYTALQSMIIGGRAPNDHKLEAGTVPKMDRTLWKPKAAVISGVKMSDALGIPTAAKPAIRVEVCSFCQTPLDERTLTRGIGKPRKIKKTETITDPITGVASIVERILHVPVKVVACPDCVLEIKPVYNRCSFCKGKTDAEIAGCRFCKGTKEGEKVSTGIKFRETPG